MIRKKAWAVLTRAVLAVLPIGHERAQAETPYERDGRICNDEKASSEARLAACSGIIRANRPGETGGAYIFRIDFYDKAGKLDLAIKDADAAIRANRNDEWLVSFVRSMRFQLLMQKGDYKQAINILTGEINRGPAGAGGLEYLYSRRSLAWELLGDLDRALADATEAIRLNPTIIDSYKKRAALLRTMGQFDRALADLNEAVRRSPTISKGYLNRASFWVNRAEFEKAKDDFLKAMSLTVPSDGEPWGIRALMWRDLGEYDLALADYDESIRRHAENGVVFASRGEIWRLKGDLDRALADQNVGLEKYPGNEIIHILRGDTLRYRGDLQGALADYDAASRRDIAYLIPIATGRGLTYEKMGDFTRARSEFQTAVKARRGRVLDDMNKSRFETAQARLAALDSGAPQPKIAPAPLKATQSIPTQEIIAPTPVQGPVQPPSAAKSVGTGHASQGRRVALVIGNSAYTKVSELRNPRKDADAVAASLRRIGFEHVALLLDASKDNLIEALRAFAAEADKADWAMVYYAGHGIEVNGRNYLIPVDAGLKADRDVQFEAVMLDQVMSAIEGVRKIKLIVLDACRDNPFMPTMEKTAVRDVIASTSTAGGAVSIRSVGRGLGEVKVSGASLVVFAAKHGQTALDGDGANSPFAIALVHRIGTPGVEINKVFRLVRDDVMEATAGRQEPYTYGSLPGREDFYFVVDRSARIESSRPTAFNR